MIVLIVTDYSSRVLVQLYHFPTIILCCTNISLLCLQVNSLCQHNALAYIISLWSANLLYVMIYIMCGLYCNVVLYNSRIVICYYYLFADLLLTLYTTAPYSVDTISIFQVTLVNCYIIKLCTS